MHLNFDIIKKHPYVIGGIALVVFLYIYLHNSGDHTGAVVSAAPSDTSLQQAELNAATGLQIAQVQANAQVQQANAAANVQAQQNQAAIQLAQIQANVSNNQTVAAQNVSENSNATQQAIQIGAQQSQVDIAKFADETQAQLANYAATTAQHQIDATTQLGELQYLAPVAEEQIAAGVEESQIQAESNFRNSTIAQAVQLQANGKGGGGVINNLIGAANGPFGLEAVQRTNYANANEVPNIIGSLGGALRGLFA